MGASLPKQITMWKGNNPEANQEQKVKTATLQAQSLSAVNPVQSLQLIYLKSYKQLLIV